MPPCNGFLFADAVERVAEDLGVGLLLPRGRLLLALDVRALSSGVDCSTGLGFLSSGRCIQLLREVNL